MASKFAKKEKKDFCWWREFLQFCLVYFILYPFFKTLFRVEVHGRENIPKDKSILVAANHTSYFDPVIIALAVKKPIAYMAKEELFRVPVLSQAIHALGAFAVNRKKLEMATIKTAKNVLETKWLLGIFPEGTRISNGKVGNIHKGFGYLAKTAKSDILPIGIILKRKSSPMWGKLIVKIGKPIPAPASAEEAIEKWACAISELTGLLYEKDNSQKQVNENDKAVV